MAFPDGRPCHTPSMRRSATASVGFVVWVLMAGVASGQLPPGGTFWDDDGNVHEGAVEAVAAAGITRACGEADLYCPDRILTRAEMAAFLVRALDLPPSQRDHFSDDSDSVFEAEIDALAAAGITRGCRRGEFCPTEPVTRAQMAAFLVRALALPPASGDRFVDDDRSPFQADIEALAAAGITRGCDPPENRRFCPSDPVRRDEMASFLARALGLDQPAVPERPSLRMAFTGDVLVHSDVWRQAARSGSPFDFGPMFAPVAEVISRVDLAICHLEVPLSSDNRRLSGYPRFNAPRQVADGLAAAGFDGCSTASNHSFDQGEAGIRSTLAVLADAGLGQAGMTTDPPRESAAAIYRVGEATIGHVSATWWLNGLRLPPGREFMVQMLDVGQLLAQAEAMRGAGADVVVVSMHCCVEYVTLPTAHQKEVARRLLASPYVDLVVGHHAHVVQPVEQIGDEYILYGLGNFLSGQRSRPATQDGVVVTVEFALRGDRWVTRRVEALPTWVEGGSYRILPASRHPASWRRTERALRLLGADVEVVR